MLFGITLRIAPGEMVSLMGRNGMGKTTTVRSIMGLTRAAAGSIRFNGVQIHGLPAYRIAKLGLGLVPEGRQVFPNLTARENLLATAANRTGASDPWTLAKVFALFPRLAERAGSMANLLSGGEQQMLAIGRALMTNPRLIILDEATEGLAPLIREEIWRCLELLAQRRAIDPGHRQECRRAHPHCRSSLHHRARPRGLVGELAALVGIARRATPLSRHLTGSENPLSLKYFPIECRSVSGRNTRGVRSYDQKVEFGRGDGLRDCGAYGRDDCWMGGG